MIGDRELSFEHYLSAVKRRIWWLVVPTLLTPGLVYMASRFIPNQYTSTALVLVEQQKVPENFVKPIVTEQLTQRLQTMQEQIFSRTRLQPLIERYGLFKNEKANEAMEFLVDEMRKSINVSTNPPAASGAPAKPKAGTGQFEMSDYERRKGVIPAFYISFTAPKPELAQQVCAEITSMFVQENLKTREQSAQGTTDFLTAQLSEAKRKLDEQDAKSAAFKSQHMGRLPGQEQSNLSVLTALNAQLDAVNQARARAEQDKSFAESMLAQQHASRQPSQAAADPETLQKQLEALQSHLAELQIRYTAEYPDVIRVESEIDELKKKLQSGDKAGPSSTPDKPAASSTVADTASNRPETLQVQQLRLQVHQLDDLVREKSAEQQRLQEQIRQYEARIQMSPKVEEEYKELTRDYEIALNSYNDLLAKQTQSAMSTDLERRQEGEQFRVLDPPDLPQMPSWPVRWKFSVAGLGGGIFIGAACAFGLEMRDKRIRTAEDVSFYLQMPVLTQVPTLAGNGTANGREKRKTNRQKSELRAG